MTPSRPFPSPLSSTRTQDGPPIAASFARTLRAFADPQRLEPVRRRPSIATPIAQKRPLTTFGALRRGPEEATKRKSLQPADTQVQGGKAPLDKQAIAEKASTAVIASLVEKASTAQDWSSPEKLASAPEPALAKEAPAVRKRRQSSRLLQQVWNWLKKQNAFSAKKQLRVSETVSLGEKRFVAVVHIEGQKFLIGGGASGVSLLAELDNEEAMDEAVLNANPALQAEEASALIQPLIACAGGRSR